MRVSFFDLATCSGWCTDGDEKVCPPRQGTWRMPRSEEEPIPASGLLTFTEWFYLHLTTYKPDLIGYEAPLAAGVSTAERSFVMTAKTIAILWGLAVLVAVTAKSKNIEAVPVNVTTARKHLTGSGRPGKTGAQSKLIVRDKLNTFGWGITSLDAADAACGWFYLKSLRDKSFRPEAFTPLFMHGKK